MSQRAETIAVAPKPGVAPQPAPAEAAVEHARRSGDRTRLPPPPLPTAAEQRAERIARLVAGALSMPAGLVDLGGDAGPVVYAGEGIDPEAIARAWTRPASRGETVTLDRAAGFDGTLVAFPVLLSGKETWVAAVDTADRATPTNVEAIRVLIAELDADWRNQRESIAGWLQRLEHENRQMARAQRLIGVGTLTYDFRENHLEVSPSALSVLGRGGIETLDDLVMAFDPFDRAFVFRKLSGQAGSADVFDFEREVEQLSGERRFVRVAGEMMREDGVPAYLFATVQDVTAEKSHVMQMHDLAVHDTLTGVYNRTVFERAVAAAIEGAERDRLYAALFIVDIDHFKEINDTYGHPAGDDILRYAARALTSLVRASDTVLRLAGDEFAVIVSRAANADGVMALADRMLAALTTTVTVAEVPVRMSATIGVAVFPDDVSPRVDIYKAADQAMFEAKAAGRGAVMRFDPQMRERRDAHRAFIAAVREALENGEFTTYFQPKLELKSGSVVGFEALCRWHHPCHGILGPSSFAAAFDDREIGGPLSDVAMRGAFAAAEAFRRKGLPFGHIAINLNRSQLERVDLLDQVRALTAAHDVQPHEIVFEVLENVLIREKRTVYDNLTMLWREGFRVALDDFGTGFASLTHIREPFIQELKIDRSFVSNAVSSADDHQIVAAIVQMARKMGLTMVAEGIEDEATLAQLRTLGCTVGQGYVFAKALPFDEALDFVARQSRIHALLNAAAGIAN